ncbi:MAG TPA: prolyl oligopeptidase family serine peptidase [Acidimicrobiales bacterium]|nr:prolyl oligopeptidase family serine peptidase [Acidimicrobiales bacterium]
MSDTFPRQYARTRRFTLGEPRNITVSPDGQRVAFARSRGGSDPINCLWVLDVATGNERLVADPNALLGSNLEAHLPEDERRRRERAREAAGGVVTYATDDNAVVAAFALDGRLFVAGLVSAAARELRVPGPVFDPHPDPTARHLAYVSGATLRLAELDGRSRPLAGEPDDPDVSWGSAEFVAAEEMGRSRGYWWAPEGERLAVARVDTSPVRRWWIGDPAQPANPPTEIGYPAAGTANAVVTLHVVGLDGSRVDVEWDREAFPYLAAVRWDDPGGLLVTVQSRDQRRLEVLGVDPTSGATTSAYLDADEAWVELVPGTPERLTGGRLVMAADRDGVRRLLVDGRPVSSPDLQVRSVVSANGESVVFTANAVDDPTERHVWRWTKADGEARLTFVPGVHNAAAGGSTVVVRSAGLGHDGARTWLLGGRDIASHAETPLVQPNVTLSRGGEWRLAIAVLLPADVAADARLPVLLDPYGGPHAQRVLAARDQYLTSQWFADQGFAVVVIDGRGTPGRGSAWERAVHLDLAEPVLEDQVAGLRAAADADGRLDVSRVGIRGWSFGVYLAALAVLRRPDVFHAAVAGAPVTEWRLYDTHYTERYLGDPNADPAPYDRSSLLADAHRLERPLLLVHGLADDNVFAAHTLQLSSALLAAGRPHQVLPLSGVSHMTPQEVVAENLLLLQLEFLRTALGITPAPSDLPT